MTYTKYYNNTAYSKKSSSDQTISSKANQTLPHTVQITHPRYDVITSPWSESFHGRSLEHESHDIRHYSPTDDSVGMREDQHDEEPLTTDRKIEVSSGEEYAECFKSYTYKGEETEDESVSQSHGSSSQIDDELPDAAETKQMDGEINHEAAPKQVEERKEESDDLSQFPDQHKDQSSNLVCSGQDELKFDANIESVHVQEPCAISNTDEEKEMILQANKEEVCSWLTKNRLSLALYDRLVEQELGDLGSLHKADEVILAVVTATMTVIEKRKFQKAIKELKAGEEPQTVNVALRDTTGHSQVTTTSNTEMPVKSSIVMTASTTSTTMVTMASHTVTNGMHLLDGEEKEDAKDLEKVLKDTEESSTKARLQIEFDNEIKAVEHLIITTRAAKSGGVRFSSKALAILTASRDYHQQRAQRLQRILNDNTIALYATNRNDDHIALDAPNFTRNARAKAVTAAGKRVGFGSVKHYHDNEKTGQELINTKKAIPQPHAAELEILRLNGK